MNGEQNIYKFNYALEDRVSDRVSDLVEEHNILLKNIASLSKRIKEDSLPYTDDEKRILKEQLSAMVEYSDYLLIRIEECIY